MGQVSMLIVLVLSVQFFLNEAAPNWRAKNNHEADPTYKERDFDVEYNNQVEDESLLMNDQKLFKNKIMNTNNDPENGGNRGGGNRGRDHRGGHRGRDHRGGYRGGGHREGNRGGGHRGGGH